MNTELNRFEKFQLDTYVDIFNMIVDEKECIEVLVRTGKANLQNIADSRKSIIGIRAIYKFFKSRDLLTVGQIDVLDKRFEELSICFNDMSGEYVSVS